MNFYVDIDGTIKDMAITIDDGSVDIVEEEIIFYRKKVE